MYFFGMRRYLITVLTDRHLSESYLSQITGEYHKGEFNPGMKIIVFFRGLLILKDIATKMII
jgi:hypothetical protein